MSIYNIWIVDCFSEVLYDVMITNSLQPCHEDMATLGGGNSVAQQ